MSKSGRCYVARGPELFFYASDERLWVLTKVAIPELLQEPRMAEVSSEDEFPIYTRRAFRQHFQWDSRKISGCQDLSLTPASPGRSTEGSRQPARPSVSTH